MANAIFFGAQTNGRTDGRTDGPKTIFLRSIDAGAWKKDLLVKHECPRNGHFFRKLWP